jgi:pilus assembly protein Flp/PilA
MRKKFTSAIKSFSRDESGATLVEYSVLIGLVTVVLVTTIGLLGDQIQITFSRILTVMTNSNAQ